MGIVLPCWGVGRRIALRAGTTSIVESVAGWCWSWARCLATPSLQRLRREGEAQVATVVRDQAAADLKQPRRNRHDARHDRDKGQAGLKGAGKLAERLGWTPKSLRDLQDAAKHSEDQVVLAKQSERFAIDLHEKAMKEAERQRQRLL